jgi:hypothetical protein
MEDRALRTNRFETLVESYALATKQRPPPGHILVHNRVETSPRTHQGFRGFRAWWTQPSKELVLCDCGWRPDLGEHYRVQRPGPLIKRRGRRRIMPAARWAG